jgi:hypothetical protein
MKVVRTDRKMSEVVTTEISHLDAETGEPPRQRRRACGGLLTGEKTEASRRALA